MRLILHPDDLPQFISSPVGLVDGLLELDQLIGELEAAPAGVGAEVLVVLQRVLCVLQHLGSP